MKIGIFGAGGFGREIMTWAKQAIERQFQEAKTKIEVVFVETVPKQKSSNGTQIISEKNFVDWPGRKLFAVAIANSVDRKLVCDRLMDRGCIPLSIYSSKSSVSENVSIGPGSIICDFVTISPNVKIGSNFHANFYSYVAHDCIVGDYVTFAPRVSCNGNVIIGNNVFVGTGAIIKPGNRGEPLSIGDNAIIGMGAIVTKNVAKNTTVMGNPARPK